MKIRITYDTIYDSEDFYGEDVPENLTKDEFIDDIFDTLYYNEFDIIDELKSELIEE